MFDFPHSDLWRNSVVLLVSNFREYQYSSLLFVIFIFLWTKIVMHIYTEFCSYSLLSLTETLLLPNEHLTTLMSFSFEMYSFLKFIFCVYMYVMYSDYCIPYHFLSLCKHQEYPSTLQVLFPHSFSIFVAVMKKFK